MLCSYIEIELTKKGEKKKRKGVYLTRFSSVHWRSSVDRCSADTSTDISADSVNRHPTEGCTNYTRSFSLKESHCQVSFSAHLTIGVANGTSKNVGLGKFWQDLEISEAFLISLEVSFLHGLFLLFLSLETFYQRVSGSDSLTGISASRRVSDFTIRHPSL